MYSFIEPAQGMNSEIKILKYTLNKKTRDFFTTIKNNFYSIKFLQLIYINMTNLASYEF